MGRVVDVTSEQELQNRDKIKVLVQARENLTSASKLNDTRVKGNEIIEYTITISLPTNTFQVLQHFVTCD